MLCFVDGPWDITGAEVVSLGNATSPINKMLAVAGKLWCSCHNEIMVINPSSLELEVRGFSVTMFVITPVFKLFK